MPRRHLTAAERIAARDAFVDGKTLAEVMAAFGISETVAREIRCGCAGAIAKAARQRKSGLLYPDTGQRDIAIPMQKRA